MILVMIFDNSGNGGVLVWLCMCGVPMGLKVYVAVPGDRTTATNSGNSLWRLSFQRVSCYQGCVTASRLFGVQP